MKTPKIKSRKVMKEISRKLDRLYSVLASVDAMHLDETYYVMNPDAFTDDYTSTDFRHAMKSLKFVRDRLNKASALLESVESLAAQHETEIVEDFKAARKYDRATRWQNF